MVAADAATRWPRGGIYDQIGGGFARYSVDARWLVPHFEKMLYDNALLARAYLHGWQVTGDERCCGASARRRSTGRCARCAGPRAASTRALDADSEGDEGNFYVWTLDEMREALGRRRRRGDRAGSASPSAGNFEGAQHPRVARARAAAPSSARGSARALLERPRASACGPGLDDKRLTSWNALMIAALAEAGAVLGRDDYLDAARACAEFVLERDARRRRPPAAHLQGRRGAARRLPRGPRLPARGAARALRGDLRGALVRRGRAQLADTMIERFADPERGGFFSTADDHEELIARRKDLEDTPIPSGNSAAAFGLLRLAALTGERALRGARRVGVLRAAARDRRRGTRTPSGTCCRRSTSTSRRVREVALVGDRRRRGAGRPSSARRAARTSCSPAAGRADRVALLEERTPVDGRAAAYVCEHFACAAGHRRELRARRDTAVRADSRSAEAPASSAPPDGAPYRSNATTPTAQSVTGPAGSARAPTA